MKKLLVFLLIFTLVLAGCDFGKTTIDETADEESSSEEVSFDSLSDPELLSDFETEVYEGLIDELDSDEYFIENISTKYISKEYLEEINYNSQENIYFGYTLSELEEQFEGVKYVFTPGEDGETSVQEFQEYDDTYEQVLKNVLIGSGVILVCVTVSVVSGGTAAPAVSMIFAASAKTGTIMALSSGVISGVADGIVTGIESKDFDETLKSASLAASEGFKWGAISGVLIGGAESAIALKGATLNGLTMNEAALIQRDSKYSLDVITKFSSKEEYEIYKAAKLKEISINGKSALIQKIDLKYVDEATGKTNLELMRDGYAPFDSTGAWYELHHIGQDMDSPLAVLSQIEHDASVLHTYNGASRIDRNIFSKDRVAFWKAFAKLAENGGL